MPPSMVTTSQERSKYHQKTVDLYRSRSHYQTWSDLVLCALNAAFRLACRIAHCRFDDDICTIAQAPLAPEG